MAGIDRNTPDPANGKIVRDESGEATGALKEAAGDLIDEKFPSPLGPNASMRSARASMKRTRWDWFGYTAPDRISNTLTCMTNCAKKAS